MGHESVVSAVATAGFPGGVAAQPSASHNIKRKEYGKRFRMAPWLMVMSLLTILIWGWGQREYRYLTAESGWGYALGIIGGSVMLALMLYPLRKRVRFMARLGPVRWWFQTHMFFGLLGPALILLHANFSIGSTNSAVALFSMLLVAASGIVGRFLYTRTHYGMLSHKQALKALQSEEQRQLRALKPVLEHAPEMQEAFTQLQKRLIPDDRGFVSALRSVLTLGTQARKTQRLARREVRRIVREVAARQAWKRSRTRQFRRRALLESRLLISTVVKVTEFGFYERLMSLWHTLHLPLFILLIITGVFHVVAVHMY